jgi:hypothetical protein
MKKRSTLIFLVNQFNSEFTQSSLVGIPCRDFELAAQESLGLYAPPERSVQAILNYAKSLEVADTESVGKVEWVLN